MLELRAVELAARIPRAADRFNKRLLQLHGAEAKRVLDILEQLNQDPIVEESRGLELLRARRVLVLAEVEDALVIRHGGEVRIPRLAEGTIRNDGDRPWVSPRRGPPQFRRARVLLPRALCWGGKPAARAPHPLVVIAMERLLHSP